MKANLQFFKNVLDAAVYVCISAYFTYIAIKNYFWLDKGELGTIYKMALPGHVVYPTISICPAPSKKVINAMHLVNETWNIPKPTLDALTMVKQSYYQNDK